jgi:hypothetical protein
VKTETVIQSHETAGVAQMEGYIVGDLVLCIGQSAILVGREVKSLNGKVPYFQDKVSPIFVYVDDFGISDNLVKKTDYYYRYPKRCSTYFEGFACGNSIVEYVLTLLESSDTCQSISILYSADEGLGSGVTAFLVQYIATYLPGLVTLTVGILPHLSQGGLASVNTSLGMEKCLEFSSCCLLRRMDDTNHVLLGHKNRSKSSAQGSDYEDVSRCLAADILLAIREVSLTYLHCPCQSVSVLTAAGNVFKLVINTCSYCCIRSQQEYITYLCECENLNAMPLN